MDADAADLRAAAIAAAIGEPARARMLYALVAGRARTGTDLAAIADIAPSTASVHLQRLRSAGLVEVLVQGKHKYYSLRGAEVGAALEALSVLAGQADGRPVARTPHRLRAARTCYDHLAGALGVAVHDRFVGERWVARSTATEGAYELTPAGARAIGAIGIDADAVRALRRRFAFACLDWSERRPHLGGALAAALLDVMLTRRWLSREPGDRSVSLTTLGRRELRAQLGVTAPAE